MAMQISKTNGDVTTEINTTPLIDVMLVLLTLLIITLPMQTNAVKIDLPHGPTPFVEPPPSVTVSIDFDGAILWDGQRVDRAQLDSYLVDAVQKDPQPEIHVQPDRLAHYGTVAIVLSDAQHLGVKKIGIVGEEQYAQ
jgi:biopolymer transport protein ExbD